MPHLDYLEAFFPGRAAANHSGSLVVAEPETHSVIQGVLPLSMVIL